VVLPTYNEAVNIRGVLQRVRQAVPLATILVVDDSSPDGTAGIAKEVGNELGHIEVLSRPGKSGLGSAYRTGFSWGLERGYDAFVEMDSDLSHQPEAIPDLLAPMKRGYEVVIGSRYIPGGSIPNWGWVRRGLSKAGNVYANYLLHLGVTDSTSGFRAYSRSALEKINLSQVRSDGYGFQIEMTYRAIIHGATVLEVPIQFVDREHGQSKMSMEIVTEALWLVSIWGVERIWGRIKARGRALSEQMKNG